MSTIAPPADRTVSTTRIAVASFIGTAIEFYDFYIYGTAAALVLGKLFFPTFSALAGTLAAFATFGVGFVARPIGAVIFGHFGDRTGRKAMLVTSLLVMGTGTVAIGLLPTYGTVGIAAPVLLVLCRFLQGVGLGGEWGGAVLLATEYAPRGKRGLWSSFPQMGPAIGFIVAGGSFLLLGRVMDDAAFESWGWRIPFLASAALVVVGYYIRMRIAETPVFREAMDRNERTKAPIVDVVRRQGATLALSTCAFILAHTLFYTITTFALSYGTTVLDLDKDMLLLCAMAAALVLGLATPVLAVLSDRVGRRTVCLSAGILAALWAYPMFALINTGEPLLIGLAMAVGMLAFAALYGPMGAFLPEMFATRYRYTGASVAYNASGIVGGGVTPVLATQLVASTDSSVPVSGYIVVIALISAVCVWFLKETHTTDLGYDPVAAPDQGQG
ncbi:MHS family MFS transporter [Streptomyces hygroscopicus subsp. hygroscopicus]|uniref:Metabolite-proton symporter n=1 Tax=Streptomyces demainii TaxID=588122 RepID=A0ABT9KU49_9ACTN|nr:MULTISPECIES: MFS transporter [Streptomyces]MBW8089252.1 MHS family MFS transporter [Streptomyces hygroscopicus subsp. hygroscopicus]MCO8304694.1 MHS family MFS transporter [Streptomyces sp. RKCA744]MDP9611935.1 metabolite-proton symporter [Streptomyces demainii]